MPYTGVPLTRGGEAPTFRFQYDSLGVGFSLAPGRPPLLWDGINSEGLTLGVLWQVRPGGGGAVQSPGGRCWGRNEQTKSEAVCLSPQSNVTFSHKYNPDGPKTGMAITDLAAYLLGSFATVAEVGRGRGRACCVRLEREGMCVSVSTWDAGGASPHRRARPCIFPLPPAPRPQARAFLDADSLQLATDLQDPVLAAVINALLGSDPDIPK